jgi:hypothetical protein
LGTEKEKIYESFYKWVQKRQELYGQPLSNEVIDWMHPPQKYNKINNPLLSSLKFNEFLDGKNN